MEKLGLNEIRELFLSFYQSKEHYRRQSFPLIPATISLLIINSGMAPLQPYFGIENTAEQAHNHLPEVHSYWRQSKRAGYTSRHGTSSEMLGSFSFGDYFKKESRLAGNSLRKY